ncbi:MAG: 50S ribosomal protein L23 [Verrucomicrobium sp.]|nr:50S ribosomal protein L23 [Verrucomicrobium sp.]
MRDPYDIIKTARVTEKATALGERGNQYVFEVCRKATKIEIKYAIQRIFNKTVTNVNTLNVRGKLKRTRLGKLTTTSAKKKAVVTLKAGEKIELV